MKVIPMLGVLTASAAATAVTAACVSKLNSIVNARVPRLNEPPEADIGERTMQRRDITYARDGS